MCDLIGDIQTWKAGWDTGWLTGSWLAQTMLSGVVGALMGYAVGMGPARKAAKELKSDLAQLKKIESIILRALEGSDVIDPIRRDEVGDPLGISHAERLLAKDGPGIQIRAVDAELGEELPDPDPRRHVPDHTPG